MAKNIKLGNNTLNGFTELKVQDATGGGFQIVLQTPQMPQQYPKKL